MQDIRLRLDWSRAAPGLFKAREVFQRRIQGATSRVERTLCADVLAAMGEMLMIRARTAETLREPDRETLLRFAAAQSLGAQSTYLLDRWSESKPLRAGMFVDEDGQVRARTKQAD